MKFATAIYYRIFRPLFGLKKIIALFFNCVYTRLSKRPIIKTSRINIPGLRDNGHPQTTWHFGVILLNLTLIIAHSLLRPSLLR